MGLGGKINIAKSLFSLVVVFCPCVQMFKVTLKRIKPERSQTGTKQKGKREQKAGKEEKEIEV